MESVEEVILENFDVASFIEYLVVANFVSNSISRWIAMHPLALLRMSASNGTTSGPTITAPIFTIPKRVKFAKMANLANWCLPHSPKKRFPSSVTGRVI